jgi:hypothetical protein
VLIGHFGVALGIKRFTPGINMGILAAAAVLSDLLWCSFLLLGWEQSEVVPGITRFSPYDMQYVPWSHGLDSILLYAAVTAIFAIGLRRPRYEALWLALAVASHGILDLIAHRPDMPAFGSHLPLGLSLYNSIFWTMFAEICIFACGAWLYLKSTFARGRVGRVGIYVYLVALLYLYIGGHFSPPPSTIRFAADSGLLLLGLFCCAGGWIDRHRSSTTLTAAVPPVAPGQPSIIENKHPAPR